MSSSSKLTVVAPLKVPMGEADEDAWPCPPLFARKIWYAFSWSRKVRTQSHIQAQAMEHFFISGGLKVGICEYLASFWRRSFGILPLPFVVS